MADGYVQVPPDSSGKKIDSYELATTSGTVERQRVSIPDGVDVGGEWLTRILIEQRLQNVLLAGGLRIKDDIESLRDELSDTAGLSVPTTREILDANRTYYVYTTGNDSNDGLTTGTPFLTWNAAIAAIAQLDGNGHDVTIQGNNATHTDTLTSNKPFIGFRNLYIDCAGGTLSTASTCMVLAAAPVNGTYLSNMTLTSAGGNAISLGQGIYVELDSGMVFGSCANSHIVFNSPATQVYVNNDYTISGGAAAHVYAFSPGTNAVIENLTITLSGTPAFSTAFAIAANGGVITIDGNTFSGSATGTRYDVSTNAVIYTGAAGATYLPGNGAGTSGTGGQYV